MNVPRINLHKTFKICVENYLPYVMELVQKKIKLIYVSKRKNRNVYFCFAKSSYFSTSIHRVINRIKRSFNLSWMRVRMSYHRFNHLAELLNGDLATKIGRGIFSKDLMDRECNCSLPSKVNGKCVYESKFWSKYIIYLVNAPCVTLFIQITHSRHKKNEGSFLRSPTSTQERIKIRLICCPIRTAI